MKRIKLKIKRQRGERLQKHEVKEYQRDVLRVSTITDAVQVHLQYRVIM